jgi:Protein of unknown function (DUF2934)
MSKPKRRIGQGAKQAVGRVLALVGGRATAPPPPGRRAVRDEEVRVRAYLNWEVAGRPPGDGVAFWLAAEAEIRGR